MILRRNEAMQWREKMTLENLREEIKQRFQKMRSTT